LRAPTRFVEFALAMPFLAVLLVIAVHVITGLGAWLGVGFLADDHQMVGAAVLRHRGDWTLASAFVPPLPPPGEPAVALYRPFIDLLFWLEQPWFGVAPVGYHVTNSLLHCITAIVWGTLVRRWTGSSAAALATAICFVGWPGHSEVTHWIAARTNLLSIAMASLALLLHDVALVRRGIRRWAAGAGAVLLAVVAVGSKESAVLVLPVAAAIAWQRSEGTWRARGMRVLAATAAMAVAIAAFWCWRASCIGTWGSGSGYGWKLQRVGVASALDWAQVLLAPVHRGYVGGVGTWAMVAVHAALLGLAAAAMRGAAARRAALPALAWLALGFVAAVGLERLDAAVLENVRYSYEPALGLAVLFGLGIASLPERWRVPALTAVAALHVFVLDANRHAWLRVANVYARMQREVVGLAARTQQPVRVFDAPGVHDGAFGYLNAHTEFLFWQHTQPPGANLSGQVASTMDWPKSLREIAAGSASAATARGHVVRWHDGSLAPVVVPGQWPQEPWPGVRVAFARIARERPFAGDAVPVHVLAHVASEVAMHVVADASGDRWRGPDVAVPANEAPVPIALALPLPWSLRADQDVRCTLVVTRGDAVHELPLGVLVPAAR
jgi:hypothetical protein